MTIQEMHYDFKIKLNKIDSQQYHNLVIPEIDWLLNEAQELLVKQIAFPREPSSLGFELTQRNTDDIRPLVIENKELILLEKNSNNAVYQLPEDYMFYISSKVDMSKEGCSSKQNIQTITRQHDDVFEQSPFTKSSFEWEDVNITFDSKGIRVYFNDFNIDSLKLNYIKKPAYIHNASGFEPAKQYKKLDDTILQGSQNSELPPHTHREIVDIAVSLASNNLNMENFQYKQVKLKTNNLN